MNDMQLDALIDEVDSKPGLGVEDSAGLLDFDEEAAEYEDDMLDREDWAKGQW